MTIERHTSYFNLVHKTEMLQPGTADIIELSRRMGLGRKVHVINHDTIEIEYLGSILPNDVYSNEDINRMNITSFPLGTDFLQGKIKTYSWKPGVPESKKVPAKLQGLKKLNPQRSPYA